MISINDLTGIQKRIEVMACLNDLLTFRDDSKNLLSIISGYNYYSRQSPYDSSIVFSHIHATDDYKRDMFKDLRKIGCADEASIREKTGIYLWKPKYIIRDDQGDVLPELRIRDLRTDEYVPLDKFVKPLKEYPAYVNADGFLFAEDRGWQLDLPFISKSQVLMISQLFSEKSSHYSEDHWSDAYETPVLLFGYAVEEYVGELPDFVPAVRFILEENDNEISFIIRKNFEKLRNLSYYEELLQFGFKEKLCFGNKLFIEECVDGKR